MPLCKGARLKIKRADKHIAELESCINRLKNALVVSAHFDAERGFEFIKCDFASEDDRAVLDHLPVVLGDIVHNLKCALDYVWQETTARLIPSRDWRKTKFPCFPTPDALERALGELQINIDAPNFFRFLISDIEPYGGGNFAIRPVHEIDRRDKHRLLIPVVHYSSIGDIYLQDQDGKTWRGDTWGTTMPLPHFVQLERGTHIKHPGSASFDVMFEEGDARIEVSAPYTLHSYSEFIFRVVELMETFSE